jgi:uncharacterized membrane protein required for colicin V production
MIAVATQSFALDKVPFGWFDVLFLALLVFGLFRGRRNGMTKEVLPMFQWLAVVLVCGLAYEMVGQRVVSITGLGRTASNVLGYLALAFVGFVVFIMLKNALTPRLTGSNIFGGGEYYLGMFAGLIRYLCMIFFALALLNAPHYSVAEIQAQKEYAFNTFGGGEQGFTGDFFPTMSQVQESVFKKSLIGPWVTDHLGVILINNVPPQSEKPPAKTPMIHIGN